MISKVANPKTMSEAATTRPPRTIPGKLFAVPFAVVVLFLLWLVFSMAVRFQTIMKQLERTRGAWPAASVSLFDRYESFLESSSDWSEPQREALRRGIEDAKKVTQFDQQSPKFRLLEQLVRESNLPKDIVASRDFTDSVLDVMQLDRERELLQSDFVGRATVYGLRLKLPPIFDLQTPTRPKL